VIEVIVTHQDIAKLRYCNRGARRFFEQHGLDWSLFRTEGLSSTVLAATGDEMALAAIRQARIRIAGERA
jgi:hypothetical protein